MKYTVRYAHLEKVFVNSGEMISEGIKIGIMGNSGASLGAHLHLDVVKGEANWKYSQKDIEAGNPPPAPPRQANFFIDNRLFETEPEVTTFFADYRYMNQHDKVHFGYDVVPKDRHESKSHWTIYWNRSKIGKVVSVKNDPAGYGLHVQIVYEA